LGAEGKTVVNIDRRRTAVGLIVFGLVLVVFALVYPFGSESVDGGTIPLPEEVAGLSLHTSAVGRQAIDEIAGLHGQDFALTDGARGSYGTNGAVTLWVSASATKGAASQLLVAMRDKIAEGNSPYEPAGEESAGGRVIYRLEGGGQTHYYFQSGNLVIWLAGASPLADEVLAQLLIFYP
jgi:hypothetical protein